MVGDCGYCSCCAVASSLENAFNQKAEQLITVDWIEMLNGVGGFCSRSSIFAWAGVEETISILKRDTFVIPILWSGIAGWNIIDSAGFLRLATFCLLAVGFLFRPFTSTVSYFFILFYLFFFFGGSCCFWCGRGGSRLRADVFLTFPAAGRRTSMKDRWLNNHQPRQALCCWLLHSLTSRRGAP